jgi:DNA polymerase III subunit epsilon
MKLVAFDLETTGKDAEHDRILEFCFIELDANLQEAGRWTRLVNPGIAVPKEIEELTGISTAMVKDQPAFSAHAPRIQALVNDAVLIAHNHQFDVQFLNRELRLAGQTGISVGHPCIDTLFIERQVNSHRLADAYKRYTGKEMDGAHRSEADTLATIEVLRQQRARYANILPGDMEGLIVEKLDRRFSPERVRQWLDHGHRFFRDGDGTICFGFGKYKECPTLKRHDCPVDKVAKTHEDYLLWMKGRDFPDEAKATIDMMLLARQPSGATKTS